MKKKIIVSFLLIISIFTITGCGNSNKGTKEKKETKEKVTFTKEIYKESAHVKFKLPESADSMQSFKDEGKSCFIYYYTNQSSVYALYPFDDKVEKVETVNINGFNYETYKYLEGTIIHYVYRTKVNNDYHLFQYDVFDKEYEDSQVEKFMNTVEFVYDSIDYKQ